MDLVQCPPPYFSCAGPSSRFARGILSLERNSGCEPITNPPTSIDGAFVDRTSGGYPTTCASTGPSQRNTQCKG
jgi:hypothetical protein